MTTKLTKPVKRKSGNLTRDGRKFRNLIITIYPNREGDYIGIRPEGTRREEMLPLDAAYHLAIKMRVSSERAEKAKIKADKKKKGW